MNVTPPDITAIQTHSARTLRDIILVPVNLVLPGTVLIVQVSFNDENSTVILTFQILKLDLSNKYLLLAIPMTPSNVSKYYFHYRSKIRVNIILYVLVIKDSEKYFKA